MLLSRPQIQEYLEMGAITIDPFKPENLGSTQYDVTLGETCFREAFPGSVYNPMSKEAVQNHWLLDHAVTHRELKYKSVLARDWPLDNIGLDEKIILVAPGETVLAHTQEFIGGSCEYITTMMKARSTMGRNHIEVCKCAGMGDVGYFTRWTMEITNNGKSHIPLVVGHRIAQILFFQVAPIGASGFYHESGKYQGSSNIEELKRNWSPNDMIPKQWLDREVLTSTGRR